MQVPKVTNPPLSPTTPQTTEKKSCGVNFDFFKNHVWKNVDNANSLARKSIKVVTAVHAALKDKLSIIVARLGMLSFISLLYTLKAIPETWNNFVNSIKKKFKDHEEILFYFSDLILTPTRIFDDIMTFMDGLKTFISFPQKAFFAVIGLPLAICNLGYLSLKGIYDIIQLGFVLHALRKEAHLETYLNTKLEADPKEAATLEKHDIELLKAKNINRLTRRTDKKVVGIMITLQKNIKENNEAAKAFNLKYAKKIMARKIVWASLGTLSTLVLTAAMITSLFFPLPALIIPIIALTRAGISAAKHVGTQYFLYRGIQHQE